MNVEESSQYSRRNAGPNPTALLSFTAHVPGLVDVHSEVSDREEARVPQVVHRVLQGPRQERQPGMERRALQKKHKRMR